MKETTRNEMRDASVFSKLSTPTRRMFEAFVKTGAAEKAIAEHEGNVLAERRALIEELVALETRVKVGQPKLEAAVVKARAAVEEAEAAMRRSRDDLRLAEALACAPAYALAGERERIHDELRETADPRLEKFVFELSNMMSRDMPMALKGAPDEAKRRQGIEPAYSSNIDDVTAARAALAEAIAGTEAQRLAAIGAAEVFEFLDSSCAKLAPVLAAVWLNPPAISTDGMEVWRPAAFSGKSLWIVDESPELAEASAEKAKSKAKAKAA